MKYTFRWRERAVRELRAIPQPTALTILRALTPLGDDPRREDASIKKLVGYTDRYRLRVGDYRLIYEIVDDQLIILIVGVGHRREAYRRSQLRRAPLSRSAGILSGLPAGTRAPVPGREPSSPRNRLQRTAPVSTPPRARTRF